MIFCDFRFLQQYVVEFNARAQTKKADAAKRLGQGLRKELHNFRTFLLRPSKGETGNWVLAPICSVFNIAKVVKERLPT